MLVRPGTEKLAAAFIAVTITGMIVVACVLLSDAILGSSLCLRVMDWLGRHIWMVFWMVFLLPGAVIPAWRRRNMPYADRWKR